MTQPREPRGPERAARRMGWTAALLGLLICGGASAAGAEGPAGQEALAGQPGASVGESPGASLEQTWVRDAGRALAHGFALAGDRIAVTTLDRHCLLLDRRTGEVLWKTRLKSSVQAGLTLADSTLVGVTDLANGSLICLDARRGSMRWNRELGESWGAPLVQGGRVFAASLRGRVLVADVRDGSRVWERRVDANVRAPLALADSLLLVATVGDSLLAFGSENGRRHWGVSCGGALYGAERVWCLTYEGGVFALDRATGRELARRGLPGPFRSGFAFAERLYAISTNGRIFALDPRDLASLWERDLRTAADLAPTPGGRVLWVGLRDGSVRGLRAEDGKDLYAARVDAPVAAPLRVAGDQLLVAGGKGRLAAFRIPSPPEEDAEGEADSRERSPRSAGKEGVGLRSSSPMSRCGSVDSVDEEAARGRPDSGTLLVPGKELAGTVSAPTRGRSWAEDSACREAVLRTALGEIATAGAGSDSRAGSATRGSGLARWLATLGCAAGTGAALWLQAEADEEYDTYRTIGDPHERDRAFRRAEVLDRTVVGAWLAAEACFYFAARSWLKRAKGSF